MQVFVRKKILLASMEDASKSAHRNVIKGNFFFIQYYQYTNLMYILYIDHATMTMTNFI